MVGTSELVFLLLLGLVVWFLSRSISRLWSGPMTSSELCGSWLAWCIVKQRGHTESGSLLGSSTDLFAYVQELAKRPEPPPWRIGRRRAGALWNSLQAALDVRSGAKDVRALSEEELEHISLLVNLLHEAALPALGWEIGRPLMDILDHMTPARRYEAAQALSAVAREQVGSRLSLDLLEKVRDQIGSAPREDRVRYFFNLGNCWKDLGDFDQARRFYEESVRLGKKTGSVVLGPAYLQLGRLEFELGQDLEKAHAWLAQAEAVGVSSSQYRFGEVLSQVGQVQSLYQQGNLPAAAEALRKALAGLPTPPHYHEEAALQTVQSRLAGMFNLPLAQEWCARLAAIAMELGQRSRESGSLGTSLGLALSARRQGPEARYWFAKAQTLIAETAEALHEPAALCSLGWGMYVFGRRQEAMKFLQKSVDVSRTQRSTDGLIHSLAQLSLVSAGVRPDLSDQAALEATGLLEQARGGRLQQLQAVFLVTRDLLATSPDVLLRWPEALRTSKVRMDAEQPHLQALLDAWGERGSPEVLPPDRAVARRGLYNYLCDRGFLDFLRRFMALPAYITVEWILARFPEPALRRRMVLEWLINPEAIPLEARRGHPADESWKGSLPRLRALMMRYFFERDLAADTGGYHPFPLLGSEDQREALLSFYRTCRSVFVIDPGALDPVQEPGVRLDNFLDTELWEPLEHLRQSRREPLPVLVDLFQGEKESWWLVADLASGREAPVSIHPIGVNMERAQEMVRQIRRLLERQETGTESVDRLRDELLGIVPDDFFESVLSALPAGCEIALGLAAPWSAVPVEQLPIDRSGAMLLDRWPVVRRDPFRRWLEVPGPDRELATPGSAVVLGNPQPADGSAWPAGLSLPQAEQEACDVAGRLGVEPITGSRCTRRTALESLPGTSILHLACHGRRFPDLGDFTALLLADGYLLGQELAALDLGACRLAVLSTCVSGTGELFGSSPVESLGNYLLEAGAQTTVTSLSSVQDEKAVQAIRRFYGLLQTGLPVGAAASAAFGPAARQEDGVVLYPWVLAGRSGPVFPEVIDGTSEA